MRQVRLVETKPDKLFACKEIQMPCQVFPIVPSVVSAKSLPPPGPRELSFHRRPNTLTVLHHLKRVYRASQVCRVPQLKHEYHPLPYQPFAKMCGSYGFWFWLLTT